MKRHLLIDADVLAYKAASSVETACEWEPGYWTWHCGESEVKAKIEDEIAAYMDHLEATSYTLCLTDDHNFRKDVLSTYKSNRKAVKKPLVLKAIREWLLEEHEAFIRPGLEGDDVMGILATWPKFKKGMKKIIVSIDKDMKTIPGLYCRDLTSPLMDVLPIQADQWHLIQTLAGDPTDGYGGCPGIGLDRAIKAIEGMTKLVPYEHEVTRGPRKGELETRYNEEETDSLWEVVLSRYQAAGLSEEVALEQARVARILRASDYNFKKKEVILWTPT